MRTLRRPLIAVAALVAFAVPALAVGATGATFPTRHLPATGGTFTWTAPVKSAGWCAWSSSPKVPKFNTTVRCNAGKVKRTATFKPNTSPYTETYTLTLTVRTKTMTVANLAVIESVGVPHLELTPNIDVSQGKSEASFGTYQVQPTLDTDGIPVPPNCAGTSLGTTTFTSTGTGFTVTAQSETFRVVASNCAPSAPLCNKDSGGCSVTIPVSVAPPQPDAIIDGTVEYSGVTYKVPGSKARNAPWADGMVVTIEAGSYPITLQAWNNS